MLVKTPNKLLRRRNPAVGNDLEMAMATMIPLRQKASGWTFGGSSSFGASVAYVSGEEGHIHLNDPSGSDVGFWYLMLGGGVSEAVFKIPFSITAAPSSLLSTGKVYVTQSFNGSDLTREDLSGMFIARELSGGMLWGGGSGTIILAGIKTVVSKVDTAFRYFYPMFNTWRDAYDLFFGDDPVDEILGIGANAVVVMAGMNTTMAWGVGGAQYVGWLK
jgi:hypothetical protein